MSLHAILLQEADDAKRQKVAERIHRRYPQGHYCEMSNSFLLRSQERAAAVAKNVGIRSEREEDEKIPGVVFTLDSGDFSGFAPPELWKLVKAGAPAL